MRRITLRKIAGILTTVATVFVVLLAAAILYSKANSKIFFVGNRSFVFVMTESMEPEIPARSYIRVEKVGAADISVGDVIVFYSDDPAILGSLNTHRVQEIAADGTGFITKGDNNVAKDAYLARAEAVVARYVKPAPLFTAVSNFFLSKFGLIVVLAGIFALCMGMYLPDVIRVATKSSVRETEKERDELIRARIAEEVAKLKAQNDPQPPSENRPSDQN